MVTRSSRARRAPQPAAPSPPAPQRARRKAAAKPAARVGAEVVGRLVDISWPSETAVWYTALVVEYDAAKRQHKVIYISDESIEIMELGTGPNRREFRLAPIPDDDPLIGAEIVLSDSSAAATASETCFDFMRDDAAAPTDPFLVTVYAALKEADLEDITGPSNAPGPDARLYRVIHLPNDYLTTVDLAQAEHTIRSQPNASAEDAAPLAKAEVLDVDAAAKANVKPHTKPDPDADAELDPTADTDPLTDAEPVVPSVRARSTRGARAAASKKVDVAPVVDVDDDGDDEEVKPVDADPTASIRNDDADAAKDDDDYKPVVVVDDDDEGTDDEAVKPARSSQRVKDADAGRGPTRGRGRRPAAQVKVTDDDDIVADSLDNDLSDLAAGATVKEEPAASRRKKGKPPAPVPSGLFPEQFKDEKSHDTASDEEKLGWVPSRDADGQDPANGNTETENSNRAPENRPQVGDFISLDTGGGGDRRQAFVEAYFPSTGSHFVALCDSRGGHLQVKLTNDNYSLISDADVEKMTSDPAPPPEDDDDAVQPRRTRGRASGSTPAKRGRETPTSAKGKKKAAKRYASPKILGKSAGEEIVSRCVSVVWPGSKLVYVALVMGYSPESRQHILLYMVDHCVETLDLRYREWELLERGNEPWNSSGMVGKRIFVWWPGEYGEPDTQELSERLFGEETKVAYEAYVLAYVGKGIYKIIYPCNEDCENRALKMGDDSRSAAEKDWDLLDEGVMDVEGLPVIGWEG